MPSLRDHLDMIPFYNLMDKFKQKAQQKMDDLYVKDPNVILPENQVPEESKENYLAYKELENKLQRLDIARERTEKVHKELMAARRITYDDMYRPMTI